MIKLKHKNMLFRRQQMIFCAASSATKVLPNWHHFFKKEE